MWTTRTGKEVRGTRAEWCPACDEVFANTEAGDIHRTGPPDKRRCLTPDQMRRRRSKPLAQNAYGEWTLAKNLKRFQ